MADLAFTLRNTEDKVTALLDDLVEKGLLDVTGDDPQGRYTPHNWASRQYKSDVSAERTKRYRQRQRDVTVTAPDLQNRTDNRTEAVTALIEVSDEAALAAWDAYGRATTGKAYPWNRRGGWCHP